MTQVQHPTWCSTNDCTFENGGSHESQTYVVDHLPDLMRANAILKQGPKLDGFADSGHTFVELSFDFPNYDNEDSSEDQDDRINVLLTPLVAGNIGRHLTALADSADHCPTCKVRTVEQPINLVRT